MRTYNVEMTILAHHAVLLVLLACAIFLSAVWSPSPAVFTLLFFALPAAYIIYVRPHVWVPALSAALLFGLLYGVSFDYIVEISGEWIFPRASEFYAPNIFLGVVSGDVLLWFFLWVFLVVAYHEAFIDRRNRVARQSALRLGAALLLGIIPLVSILIFRSALVVPYSYAILGLCALVPVAVLFMRNKYPMKKLWYSTPYFVLLFLCMELVALGYGYWDFTGEYIGSVLVLGRVLPVEEIILWIIGSPIILVAYHELFLDDER